MGRKKSKGTETIKRAKDAAARGRRADAENRKQIALRLRRPLVDELDRLADEAEVSRQRLVEAVLSDAVEFAKKANDPELFSATGAIIEDAVRRAIEAQAHRPIDQVTKGGKKR